MKYLSRIILAMIVSAGGLWVPASAGPGPTAQDPEVQFQRAVQLETVDGNLSAATSPGDTAGRAQASNTYRPKAAK